MPHIVNPNTGMSVTYKKTSIKNMESAIDGVSLDSDWPLLSHSKRLKYIKKFQRLLRMHQHDLMHAISTETGKPYWESFTEVHAAINKIDATIAAYDYRCSYPVDINISISSIIWVTTFIRRIMLSYFKLS